MDNINKEQWINDVLDSTQGMSRAVPGNDLHERIVTGMSRPEHILSVPVVKWAAAAALLVALNISSVVYYNTHNRQTTTSGTENPIALAMQSENSYNY